MGRLLEFLMLSILLFAGSAAAQSGGMYIYPAKGQDKNKQDEDRYDCHSWAVSQTGFDPSKPQSKTPGSSGIQHFQPSGTVLIKTLAPWALAYRAESHEVSDLHRYHCSRSNHLRCPMIYEAFEDKQIPGDWRVEAVEGEDEKEIPNYVTLFYFRGTMRHAARKNMRRGKTNVYKVASAACSSPFRHVRRSV